MNAKERLAILKAEELRRAREASHVPAADDYSAMTREEVIKMLEQVLEESRGLHKQISDLNQQIRNLNTRIAEKDRKIDELTEKILEMANNNAALQKQIANYADQLAQQRKGLYGRKSQKGTSVTKHEKTRQEENSFISPPLSQLMEKATNYMWNQWDPIFLYRKDGDYDIDNNLAERTIRPLTGERKASLFFSSHKGARASAICNTIHATCKAMGISFYAYLKKFFNCIAMGRRDYENLLPQTLPL